uniref:hypothetical protein n=1 Tax=Roseivirga sp. TaxID=1964215 RepID=UPI004048330C
MKWIKLKTTGHNQGTRVWDCLLVGALCIFTACVPSAKEETGYAQNLVYTSDRNGFNLYQIDELGQWEKQLTFGEGQEWRPKWNEGLQSLVYYAQDGAEEAKLTVLSHSDKDSLAWIGLKDLQLFPDAQSILFTVKEETGKGIWMSNLMKGEMKELVSSDFNNESASISPDGKSIAFTSDRTGSTELFKLDVETLVLTQLTDNNSIEKYSSWSPDGQRIVFNMRDATEDAYEDLYIIHANGTGLEQLTKTPYAEHEMAWSLDGKKIAFHATSIADGDQIYSITLANGHFVKITSGNYYHGEPTWVKVKP